MHITLSPVYSRLASEIPPALQPLIPAGWRLSQHQVETYLALADPTGPEVVINTAMTGDGKSLGGQLMSLQQGWQHPLFTMYPTNELIADQARQAEMTWQRWQQRINIGELNSRVLDEVMASEDFRRRGDALLSRFENREVILTNPDIFHYIMHMFYVRGGKHGDAPDQIIGRLLDNFNQFTFDEFHVFETPQIISVMSALLLLRAIAGVGRKRFLFQSATPSSLLHTFLDTGEFSFREISGDYLCDATQANPALWRQILQQSELHFAEGSVETWLDENLENVLLPFFVQNHPAAKGAIIVNSIAQAKRVRQRLEQAFAPYTQIRIGENTGLTTLRKRRESYDAEILVGTSTVDVGVDFHINFLLFESRDAGSFLQRLGRLGRHSFYRRDGQEISFEGNYVAYALLPRWTLESLFQGQAQSPAPLTPEMLLPRTELAQIINDTFPPPTAFERYLLRWGGLQSVKVLSALKNPTIRNQYSNLIESLSASYQQVLRVNNKTFGRYRELAKDAKVLLQEAITFRGGTYFDCGVLDMTERNPNEQAKRYDLLWLIANGDLAPLSKEEFWAAASRAGIVQKANDEPIAYFRLLGYRPERANFTIMLEHDMMEWDSSDYGVARELRGVAVDTAYLGDVPNLNGLNRVLARKIVPAFVCQCYSPLELKRRLRLPLLFALYAFRSRDGLEGSIAFGREALLLDSATHGRGLDCGGGSLFL